MITDQKAESCGSPGGEFRWRVRFVMSSACPTSPRLISGDFGAGKALNKSHGGDLLTS